MYENNPKKAKNFTKNFLPLSNLNRQIRVQNYVAEAQERTFAERYTGLYFLAMLLAFIAQVASAWSSYAKVESFIKFKVQDPDTLLAIVLACLLIAVCSIKAQDLSEGLLVHYPMNSTAIDISGNGYNGSVNSVSNTVDHLGFENAAFEFNGTNSYIEIPQNSNLEPELPITIAFRVKFDDLEAAGSQILGTDFLENTYTGIWFGLNPVTYQMQVSYGDGTLGCTTPSCRRTKQGTTVLQTDTWYRVVGIVRGPQDMDIYIDCRNDEGQYTGTGGDIAYSNQSGSIGRVDQSSLAPY